MNIPKLQKALGCKNGFGEKAVTVVKLNNLVCIGEMEQSLALLTSDTLVVAALLVGELRILPSEVILIFIKREGKE